VKNLFIIKRILEDMNLSDEAFTVWCGLRNILQKDREKYFVSYSSIGFEIFDRQVNRYETNAIKKGFNELTKREYINVITSCNTTDFIIDLSALFYNGNEFFSDITREEMHKIMNIDSKCDKYKLLRYFACQVGTFNRSDDMRRYKGKIGGISIDYFEKLIPINKSTVISFNRILEQNELLFVIRHKDFYQSKFQNGSSEIREIPNTYSRWKDRKLAQEFAEEQHGYKYEVTEKGLRTDAANKNRSLGQKLNNYICNHIEYDDATVEEMREYAEKKNTRLKNKYEDEISKGYHPEEPVYIDMTVFRAVG
jgi:hypothetical protein